MTPTIKKILPANQRSVASFLTKIKKPSLSNRKTFLEEKIANNVAENEEKNVVENEEKNVAENEEKNCNESGAVKALEKATEPIVNSSQCNHCKGSVKRLKDAKMLLKKTSTLNLKKDLMIQQLKTKLEQKSDSAEGCSG